MRKGKTTRITIREDRPISISSSLHHANLTSVGFNIEFIARRQPSLAIKITKIMDQAIQIHEDDPDAPEEDVRSASDAWAKLVKTLPRG